MQVIDAIVLVVVVVVAPAPAFVSLPVVEEHGISGEVDQLSRKRIATLPTFQQWKQEKEKETQT